MFLVSNFLTALPSQLVLNPGEGEGSIITYQLEPRHLGRCCAPMEERCSGPPPQERMCCWGWSWLTVPTGHTPGSTAALHSHGGYLLPQPLAASERAGGRASWSLAVPAQCKSTVMASLCSGLPQTFSSCTTDETPPSSSSFLLSFASSCSSPIYSSRLPAPHTFPALLFHLGIFLPEDPSWHRQYYNALRFPAAEVRIQLEKRESINTFPFKSSRILRRWEDPLKKYLIYILKEKCEYLVGGTSVVNHRDTGFISSENWAQLSLST